MSNRKRKRKFRARYVVLGILVLLLVGVGTVTVTNWDNIQAGYVGLTSDPEELQAKQQEKKSQMEQSLGVEDGFTDEEMSAAQEAIVSLLPESLAEFITGTDGNTSAGDGNVAAAGDNPSGASENGSSGIVSNGSGSAGSSGSADAGGSSGGNSVTVSDGSGSAGTGSSGSGSSSGNSTVGSGSDSSVSSDPDAITRKYTAQLYALEGAMQGKIDSLTSSAKAEYASLSPEERTSSRKSAIISSALSEAEALESTCDAAVEKILSNMESELKAAGGDTGAVSDLREYYESEKASKKASAIAAMRS